MNCKKYILYFCLCLPLIASSQLFKKDSLKEHQKESKKVKKLLIPTITYNSSFKFMLGFMAAGFYNINKTDTISPVSSSSFIGGYSTNGTWYIVQPNKFYFKEDKYRS